MISPALIRKRLREQALKEQMIYDAIIILSTVEWFQERIEEKMLELDEADDDNILRIQKELKALLRGIHREEERMDEFMAKYRKRVYETKTVVSSSKRKRALYLRGIPQKPNRERASQRPQSQIRVRA